ncbi:hypothetical protein WISP_75187 [Willisornis vidua]|uniref:R3H domain-containing protein n=1 Tax=Willisornis vidua TaxID=1566151 RepID=A0ABQ9D702_9PASS|nr:hypothetical protein WISP_75187 [Willisornis vidua]
MIQWGDPCPYSTTEKKKLRGKDEKTILAKVKKKIKSHACTEILGTLNFNPDAADSLPGERQPTDINWVNKDRKDSSSHQSRSNLSFPSLSSERSTDYESSSTKHHSFCNPESQYGNSEDFHQYFSTSKSLKNRNLPSQRLHRSRNDSACARNKIRQSTADAAAGPGISDIAIVPGRRVHPRGYNDFLSSESDREVPSADSRGAKPKKTHLMHPSGRAFREKGKQVHDREKRVSSKQKAELFENVTSLDLTHSDSSESSVGKAFCDAPVGSGDEQKGYNYVNKRYPRKPVWNKPPVEKESQKRHDSHRSKNTKVGKKSSLAYIPKDKNEKKKELPVHKNDENLTSEVRHPLSESVRPNGRKFLLKGDQAPALHFSWTQYWKKQSDVPKNKETHTVVVSKGKVHNPEWNRNEIPHSCGELCGKKRQGLDCPHLCNMTQNISALWSVAVSSTVGFTDVKSPVIGAVVKHAGKQSKYDNKTVMAFISLWLQCTIRVTVRRSVHPVPISLRSGVWASMKIAAISIATKLTDLQLGDSVEISRLITKKEMKQARLQCDEECLALQRNRRLAEALEIDDNSDPFNIRSSGPKYSDLLKEDARKDLKFVSDIEKEMRMLVEAVNKGKHTKKSHCYPPMNRDHRRIIHELAQVYGIESVSYDNEPKRNVVITAVNIPCGFCLEFLHVQIIQSNSDKKTIPPLHSLPLWHGNGNITIQVEFYSRDVTEMKVGKSICPSNTLTSVLDKEMQSRPPPPIPHYKQTDKSSGNIGLSKPLKEEPVIDYFDVQD